MGFLIGCAPSRINLPTDPGTPLPEFADVHQQISSACSGVRTMTAELALSGRAGDQRLRGRVISGFVRPNAMRLEAVVAGQVIFILGAPDENAALYLPRESQALQKQRSNAILDALIGVNLASSDLQAILTGCVVPNGRATGGRTYSNGLAAVDVSATDGSSKTAATLYVRRTAGRWQLLAARRAGWRIDYPEWGGSFPAAVRLLSDAKDTPVDLTATISQLETNVELDAAAFAVKIPPGTTSITLEELRRRGPLSGP